MTAAESVQNISLREVLHIKIKGKIMQPRGATAVCVTRHYPSQDGCARIVCVLCNVHVFAPRHKVVKVMLREARRCGQSYVTRRRCAERSELLYSGNSVGLFCKENWRAIAWGADAVECQIVVSNLRLGVRNSL